MATHLKDNNFTHTLVQKAGISGFSGCLEHSTMMLHQIQAAKKEGKDFHVALLDPADAFGYIPNTILWTAFEFFCDPVTITKLARNYFHDL